MNIQSKLTNLTFKFSLALIPFFGILGNFNFSKNLIEISILFLILINLDLIFKNIKAYYNDYKETFIYLAFVVLIGFLNYTSVKALIFGLKYEVFYLLVFTLFFLIGKRINRIECFAIFKKYSVIAIFLSLGIYLFSNNEFLVNLGYRMDWSTFYLNENLAYCQKIQDSDLCRFQGFLSSPNHFGLHLLFLIFLIKKRISDLSLSILALLTFSRSSLIAIGIYLWNTLRNRLKLVSAVLGFLAVGMYSIFFAKNSTFEHVLNIRNAFNLENINWLLGNGLNFSGPASRLSDLLIPESHFVQVLLNTGLIGFGLFIVSIKKIYSKLKTYDKQSAQLLLSLIVPMFFLHPLEDTVLCYSMFGYLGLLAADNIKS